MDGDDQHDPSEIPKFIEIFKKTNADLILGERTINRKEMPFLRRAGNRLVSWLISQKIGKKISDSQSGFRLLSKKILSQIKLENQSYGVETEMIIKAIKNNLKIALIPINTIYQNKKQLKIFKDFKMFISILEEVL